MLHQGGQGRRGGVTGKDNRCFGGIESKLLSILSISKMGFLCLLSV